VTAGTAETVSPKQQVAARKDAVTGPVIRSEGLMAGPPANAGTVNVAQPVVLA
jgi:hypothetical protein